MSNFHLSSGFEILVRGVYDAGFEILVRGAYVFEILVRGAYDAGPVYRFTAIKRFARNIAQYIYTFIMYNY